MKTPDLSHLTADELDSLLDGMGSARVTSHLETCASCLAMVELDRRLVGALSALPVLDPSPDFANLVMARVAIAPSSVAVAAPSPRAVAARRRVVVGSLLSSASLVAGFSWAIANPAAAVTTVAPAFRETINGLWLSLQTAASSATSHSLIGAFGSPGKLLLALVAVSGLYVVALTGFRRLLTEPVTDARW